MPELLNAANPYDPPQTAPVATAGWQRRQRQFLCNTLWARENGFDPDRLKLFNRQSNEDSG